MYHYPLEQTQSYRLYPHLQQLYRKQSYHFYLNIDQATSLYFGQLQLACLPVYVRVFLCFAFRILIQFI